MPILHIHLLCTETSPKNGAVEYVREYKRNELAEIFTPDELLRMSEGKVIERNGQYGKCTFVDMVVASRRMRSANEPQRFDTPRLAFDPKSRKDVIVMAARLTAGGDAQYLVDDGSGPLAVRWRDCGEIEFYKGTKV